MCNSCANNSMCQAETILLIRFSCSPKLEIISHITLMMVVENSISRIHHPVSKFKISLLDSISRRCFEPLNFAAYPIHRQ